MIVKCGNCQKEIFKSTGHYNRAVKLGMGFYCDHKCHQATRKTSVDEKKAVKRAYDQSLRYQPWYKEYKRACWKRNYDPVKAAEYRAKRMAYHVEYCRSPEYREWKKEYDAKRQDKLAFGEFAECAPILEQILSLIDNRAIKEQNQLNNKSIKRKRAWLKNKKAVLPQ